MSLDNDRNSRIYSLGVGLKLPDALNISMHAVLLSGASQEVSLVHCHQARATWSLIGFRKSGFFFKGVEV